MRISNLRVENNSASAPGLALVVLGTTQVENVTAVATTGGSSPGFYESAGIAVMGSSAQNVILKNVTASAVTTGIYNRGWGIYVINAPSVSIWHAKATASGPHQSVGIAVSGSTTVDIRDSVSDATTNGTASQAYASAIEAWGNDGTVKVSGSKLVAHDSLWECYAANGETLEITSSELWIVGCPSGYAITTMKIAASLIQGGFQYTPKVTNCWDENFDPIPNQ